MEIKLSVVVITLNEERNIGRCLESVKDIADEIVVVDSFSKDKTEEICKTYGARFVQNTFKGHIQQKNFALDEAKYDHVLSLDADEALSETAQKTVQEAKQDWQCDGYTLNRLSSYCGKFIKHGSWYPDCKLRLFNKTMGRWGGKNPHDKFILPDGKTAHLKGDILHYTYNAISEHVTQANKFSSIFAQASFEEGKRFRYFNTWLNPTWRFFRDYFLKFGFLDGIRGFTIALISSQETYLKYLKLWELEKNNTSNSRSPLVIHLCSENSWRGGEQQIAYLIKGLEEHGWRNFIICKKGTPFAKWCLLNNVPFVTAGFANAVDIFSAFKIKGWAKLKQPLLVHMHSSKSHSLAVIAAKLGMNTPMILSRRVDFPIKQKGFSRVKYNHPQIQHTLCVSDKIKEIIQGSVDQPEKVHTVYSGVNLQKFQGTNHNWLREQYEVPEETVLIGNTSALADHKDYPTFLATARKIVDQGLPAKFFIIGNGEQKEAIEEKIAELQLEKDVIMTGFLENITEVLPSLDIFFMPSKTEGLGTSILDAFASKVPVVATCAGGIPELVKHEQTGLIAEVGDTETLAQHIASLIKDESLRQKLADNAWEYVQDFSKEKMVENTLHYYKMLLP